MDSSLIEEDNIQSEPMSLDDIELGRLELTKPPNAGIWHGVTQIELMYNKLSELPPSPYCPLLRVLLLQGNADLMEIPPLFFHHVPLLRTLNLSYTSITDLPISFFGLVELRVLYLRGCELFMELPPEIGQLKNLEELDLNETQITHVPTEIQELINLQNLTLSFYEYDQNIGQVIPKGLISKLTMLSYLSIDVNPDHSKWDETVGVILEEISELCFLKTLILYVPRVELLKHLPENKDLDFRLVAGHHMQRIISRVPPMVEEKFKQSNHSLRFVYGNEKDGVNVPREISMVLGHTNTFFLDRHMTIKHLSEFGLMNLEQLQVCILAECNEMQTIVEKGYSYYINVLSCLQVLSVFYMKNLRGIWEGSTPSSLFLGQLKSLTLHTCPNLTTVFTLDFIDNLVNLEEFVVQDCPKVTTLITRNSSAFSEKSFLPNIRKVSLLYLPELVSISSGMQIGPILEKIGFYYCPKLQTISTRELSSKRLKVIKGETKWWEALRWKEAGSGIHLIYLYDIFSPINEEVDIMTQLVADADGDESSSSKNQEIHNYIGDWKQRHLMNELERGRELARQLEICLSEPSPSRGACFEALVPKVTASFEEALSMVTGKVGSVGEASQPTTTGVAIVPMAEATYLSSNSHKQNSDRDLRDQGHKASTKRKAMPEWTRQIRVEPGVGVENLLDDGYIWRKYGQKEILGSKYPRDYYRCTHKNDRACLATKQVQRSDEDPLVFNIIYRGHHSCRQGWVPQAGVTILTENLDAPDSWDNFFNNVKLGDDVENDEDGYLDDKDAADNNKDDNNDYVNLVYKKHHPPVLLDEVWRLEKIARDGALHRKLSEEGIYTVQDFLRLSVVDPPKLRKILGIGMSDKMMNVTIEHAKTCIIGNKLYVYSRSHRRSRFTIVLNSICQVVKVVIDGHIISPGHTRYFNRMYLKELVREAYLRWNTLEEIDGPLNDNITLVTHGETVKQFPNPINHQLPIVASEQNEHHGDKSMEASGSGASTVT